MRKLFNFLRKPLFVFFFISVVFGLSIYGHEDLTPYKKDYIFNSFWLMFIILFSLFSVFFRKAVLGNKPYFFLSLTVYFILYLLAFKSLIIKDFVPTYDYIVIYLFATLMFLVFLLDYILVFLRKNSYIFNNAFVVFFITLSFSLLFGSLIPKINLPEVFYWSGIYYAIIIVFPVISSIIRKKLGGKKADYLKGVALYYFISFLNIPLTIILGGQDSKSFMFFALIPGWLHVYLETIGDYFKNKRVKIKEFISNSVKKSWEILKKYYGICAGKVELDGKYFKKVFNLLATKYRAHSLTGIGIIILISAAIYMYPVLFVRVVEFTPRGAVSQKTAVRISFSDPIELKVDDISKVDCFYIEPVLKGEYKMESSKTISFLPAEPLKPSTKYKVVFDSRNIKSAKKLMQKKASIRFNSGFFKVNGVKLFYLYDVVKNVEKQVMGEINFNYPVSMEELRDKIDVLQDNKEIDAELEKSNIPTRFYIKTGLINRNDDKQKIALIIKKGLNCINGTENLKSDYIESLVLSPKQKFSVTEIKTWHEAGNTYISILFNMPVLSDGIRKYIAINPAVPVEVETEYCYAVLKGNFLPNKTYEIGVLPGLVSRTGEVLDKNNTKKSAVAINDLPPKVEFARNGNILPLSGEMNIELKTTNLDKINVTVNKIFRNNIVNYLRNRNRLNANVFSGYYTVQGGRINEEVVSYINLKKMHKADYKGLFEISIKDPKNYYSGSESWFLCTNIGLIAKQSGSDLIVYALSVSGLEPVVGVSIKLISESNQIMEEKITGDSGTVVFKNWRKKEIKSLNNYFSLQAFMLTADKNDDFSFIEINSSALNQTRFQIEGEPYDTKGMEAFLSPERGVYRPGEKAYVTAIVRNKNFTVPPQFNLYLSVSAPNRSDQDTLYGKPNGNGVLTFEVNFQNSALTGEYTLTLHGPDSVALGSTVIKVEEFIPDKLKVEIETGKSVFEAGEQLIFAVKGKQLFGAPANGCRIESAIKFMPRNFSHDSFSEYKFSDPLRTFNEETQMLGEDKLDSAGAKNYSVNIPLLKPPSALGAYIYSDVYDSGGRPVSASKYISINNYSYFLGISIEKKQAYSVNDPIKVKYAAINSKGEYQKVKNVQILVKKKIWYSIFRRSSWGKQAYNSESYEDVMFYKTVDIDGSGSFSFTPDVAGEYYIIIGNDNDMRTGEIINVLGEGYQTSGLETPEKLNIILSKNIYSADDSAIVDIKAPFDGKLFLTVERERVLFTKIVDVIDRKARVSIPVLAEYIPNVYVAGLLLRTPDEKYKSLPMVSFGVVPLLVDNKTNRINLIIDCAKEANSNKGIDVTLKMENAPSNTDVILMAVDEGILQLTSFKTPDPIEYFYRKKALTTQTYSVFDAVLPEIRALKEAIGGGDFESMEKRHLNPVVVRKHKSFAVYSGVLSPDPSGEVRYHFDTSKFNGEVRVMALAVNGNKYGSASRSVTVSEPIVIIPSFPGFVSPSDEFSISARIYNKTWKSGDFTAELFAEGPVKINGENKKTVTLANLSEGDIKFYLSAADNAGAARFKIFVYGNEVKTEYSFELSVRPASHLETKVLMGMLKQNQSASIDIPANYIKQGQRIRLITSSNPIVKYISSLDYLIGYPYGCSEQITSKLFPLIYFKELGFITGRFSDKANEIDSYIKEGIEKLEKSRTPDGGYSFWPGSHESDKWLNLYISHFFIEASRNGYNVNSSVIAGLQDYIDKISVASHKGRLSRREDNIRETNTYLLYLKALLNNPDKESMGYLKTERLNTLDEFDRCMLSLCYSAIGDKKSGLEILKPDFKSRFFRRQQNASLNSPIKNTAVYLLALASANPEDKRINEIIEYLSLSMKNGHFGSTQENAWVFIAIGKARPKKNLPVKIKVLLNDEVLKTVEGNTEVTNLVNMSGKKITLRNAGSEDSYYHFMAEGNPLEKKNRNSFNGLEIKREYRDENGKEINLSSVVQGQLIFVTVKISSKKDAVYNVAVVDLLPGGFEIENTRLNSRGNLHFNPVTNISFAYQDIRDDRMLLFCKEISNESVFSYSVRAVAPGKYTVPNIYGEAMYDPEINGEKYEKDFLVVVPGK